MNLFREEEWSTSNYVESENNCEPSKKDKDSLEHYPGSDLSDAGRESISTVSDKNDVHTYI